MFISYTHDCMQPLSPDEEAKAIAALKATGITATKVLGGVQVEAKNRQVCDAKKTLSSLGLRLSPGFTAQQEEMHFASEHWDRMKDSHNADSAVLQEWS